MRWWGKAAILIIFAASAVSASLVIVNGPIDSKDPYTSQRAAEPVDGMPSTQRVAMIVGDSFAAPTDTTSRDQVFPVRTCARLKWLCFYDVEASTGYVAEGMGGSASGGSYLSRLSGDRNYDPDLVVITGGSLDAGRPYVRAAADRYLAAVRQAFPRAKIVVLEPFWQGPKPSKKMVELRATIHRAARAAKATWIPTNAWLETVSPPPGNDEPAPAVHKLIAAALVDRLAKVKVPSPLSRTLARPTQEPTPEA